MPSRIDTPKILAALLPLTLCFAATACGSSDDDTADKKDGVAETADTSKDEPKTSEALDKDPNADAKDEQDTLGDPQLEPGDPGFGDGPVAEELPVDPNADPAGGTSLNLNELLKEEGCSTGWLPEKTETDRECAATFREICFETDAEACTCAGCAGDSCQIAESYPTQISCGGIALGCNFQWFDACFETAEEACSAAGCSSDECTISESFPARVTCE